MHWGKFLAPALFLAPKSKGAVVGASPTTPKNGFGSSSAHSGNAEAFPLRFPLAGSQSMPAFASQNRGKTRRKQGEVDVSHRRAAFEVATRETPRRFPYNFSLRAKKRRPHLLRKIGKVERIAPQIFQKRIPAPNLMASMIAAQWTEASRVRERVALSPFMQPRKARSS